MPRNRYGTCDSSEMDQNSKHKIPECTEWTNNAKLKFVDITQL